MRRLLVVSYGVLVYAFFFATFLYAIAFVEGVAGFKTIDGGTPGPAGVALLVDVALLGLFAVQHSVMARQGFKRWWTRWVPWPAERSTYVLAASLALALLMGLWQPLPAPVWVVGNPLGRHVLLAVSALGWLLLLISTFLIDHFELFGLRQVVDHWRGRTGPGPRFRTPAFYRHVRHPIYLGFVLAFWAAPTMTRGRLLFALATTGYILVGIWFEERDLVALFGEEYRRYRERVPMLVPRIARRDGPAARRE